LPPSISKDIAIWTEVFEEDIKELSQALNAEAIFAPMAKMEQFLPEEKSFTGRWGVAILSTFPFVRHEARTYVGSYRNIPEFIHGEPNSLNRVFLQATIKIEDKDWKIGTTHFTWTKDGSTSKEQLDNFARLQPHLQDFSPHIFCGDLNSPRGKGGIFDTLAKKFVDQIPPEATTSIDGSLHKAGNLQLMVDALFTKPGVEVQNAKLHTGVSDHQAVTATISLT
jgi:endonuclease/exonuclease/phosphatase family metal-dependent hydrolase